MATISKSEKPNSQLADISKYLNSAGKGIFLTQLEKIAAEYGLGKTKRDFTSTKTLTLSYDTKKAKKPLIPPMFKRIINENADRKMTPVNEQEVNDNIVRQLSYQDDFRTASRDFVFNLIEDSWNNINKISRERYGRKGRVDLDEFSASMIDVLPEELHEFYKVWDKTKKPIDFVCTYDGRTYALKNSNNYILYNIY